MSLKLLQPGCQPLGQFDGLDTEVLTLKGGEVVTFTTVLVGAATDKAASDSTQQFDVQATKRVVVTKTLVDGYARPLMLADEGITGYGTLFGTVVGGTVGQTVYGPNSTVAAANLLGPHTATGSGKVTCWEKPGLYAVSLDAVEQIDAPGSTTTGLQPTNTNVSATSALYATSGGLLTPTSGNSFDAAHAVLGRFVNFETNGSLVTTPNSLVAALNSPSGNVSSVGAHQYAFAVIYFNPPSA